MKYLLSLILLAGCVADGDLQTGTSDEALASSNGLSLNGLSLNGTSLNGLSLNGLDLGLATSSFASWFHADPANRALQMQYVVKCAKPAGVTVTWTDPATHTVYSWPGGLGLAPTWSNRAMTVAEQQVLSACMAAHANKYGVHVPIAVEGQAADGTMIARAANELTDYSSREAAFFGNTVSGDGAYVCLAHLSADASVSSARACALDMAPKGPSTTCPPLIFAGACSAICTPDATKTFYTSCTVGTKTYRPLATRLQPSSIYRCGDGVCQFTAHCGSGPSYDSCKADCGLCP